jgi:hypothetical protein
MMNGMVIAYSDYVSGGVIKARDGTQRFQFLLSLCQRLFGQVLAVKVKQVENVCDDPLRSAAVAQRCLQCLEAALAFGIKNHRFHVQDRIVGLQFLQGSCDCRKTSRPVIAVACAQARLAARHETKRR